MVYTVGSYSPAAQTNSRVVWQQVGTALRVQPKLPDHVGERCTAAGQENAKPQQPGTQANGEQDARNMEITERNEAHGLSARFQ